MEKIKNLEEFIEQNNKTKEDCSVIILEELKGTSKPCLTNQFVNQMIKHKSIIDYNKSTNRPLYFVIKSKPITEDIKKHIKYYFEYQKLCKFLIVEEF